jgi:hypothetical protein
MTKTAKRIMLGLGIASAFYVSDLFAMGQFMAHQKHTGWVMEEFMGAVHILAIFAMIACAVQIASLAERKE